MNTQTKNTIFGWLLVLLTIAVLLVMFCGSAYCASYRTKNFIVYANQSSVAEQVAETAESYRALHWQAWYGNHNAPDWEIPCAVEIKIDTTDGGGSTSYLFDDRGGVSGFRGSWFGRLDRILDSVVPHEVMHTVLATESKSIIPRWIDEGIASTVEHPHSKENYHGSLVKAIRLRRVFRTSHLMQLSEYPQDFETFYSQSVSVVAYLLSEGGRPLLVDFVRKGTLDGWESALSQTYGVTPQQLHAKWWDWLYSDKTQVRHKYEYQVNQCPGGQCRPVPGYWVPQSRPMVAVRETPTPPVKKPRPQPSKGCDCGDLADKIAANQAAIDDLSQRFSDSLDKTQASLDQFESTVDNMAVLIEQQKQLTSSYERLELAIQNTDRKLAELAAANPGLSMDEIISQLPSITVIHDRGDGIAQTEEMVRLGGSLLIEHNQAAPAEQTPFYMRVHPEAPYMEVKPGSYVTLPLNKIPHLEK